MEAMRIAYFETPIADASTKFGALVEDLTLECPAIRSEDTHSDTEKMEAIDERHYETEPVLRSHRAQRFVRTQCELDPRLVETQLFHTTRLRLQDIPDLDLTKEIQMPRPLLERLSHWLSCFLTRLGVLPTRLPEIR